MILAEMDVVMLSRIQFALTIMFHYLFPPLTIGLGVIIAYLEGMYLWKKEPIYMDAARFWTQIFGVNFAIGVATGIAREFEFGTNWPIYSRFVEPGDAVADVDYRHDWSPLGDFVYHDYLLDVSPSDPIRGVSVHLSVGALQYWLHPIV